MSQSSILGENLKTGYQPFNDLGTPKLSKKPLCDRTLACVVSREKCRTWIMASFRSRGKRLRAYSARKASPLLVNDQAVTNAMGRFARV